MYRLLLCAGTNRNLVVNLYFSCLFYLLSKLSYVSVLKIDYLKCLRIHVNI